MYKNQYFCDGLTV